MASKAAPLPPARPATSAAGRGVQGPGGVSRRVQGQADLRRADLLLKCFPFPYWLSESSTQRRLCCGSVLKGSASSSQPRLTHSRKGNFSFSFLSLLNPLNNMPGHQPRGWPRDVCVCVYEQLSISCKLFSPLEHIINSSSEREQPRPLHEANLGRVKATTSKVRARRRSGMLDGCRKFDATESVRDNSVQ